MPLDYTHAHLSSQIMQEGHPNTPINPEGGGGLTNPLTEDLDADGQALLNALLTSASLTNDLNAAGHKITGLSNPVDPGDAVNQGYVADNYVAAPAQVPSLQEVLEATPTGTVASLPDGVGLEIHAGKYEEDDDTSGAQLELGRGANAAILEAGNDDTAEGAWFQADPGFEDEDGPAMVKSRGVTFEVLPFFRVVRDLNTGEIADLGDDAIELVAAPGADKMIVPISAVFQFVPGDEPFGDAVGVGVRLGSGGAFGEVSVEFDTLGARFYVLLVAGSGETDDANNTPMSLKAGDPVGLSGSILTASLGDAGTGYAPGDTGVLVGLIPGGDTASYEILTVGGGGEVETFEITADGTRFTVRDGFQTTPSDGAGDGNFTVNVDSITPLSDGTGRVTVLYYIVDLLGGPG